METQVNGDERYTFIDEKTIYKVDLEGKPDMQGLCFHLLEELEDGYTVYIKPQDPSQPNPSYFIHKKFFVK